MTHTVLFAQEFGTNLGHVTRLIAVAEALQPCRTVFAVPHADVAAPVIRRALGPDVEIVGGMRFVAPASACTPSSGDSTLADVFFHLGYAHKGALGSAAAKWRSLIERIRPDLIVADFAPTVRLACWDRIPVVVIGGSYETPPADGHLPTVVPFGAPPSEASLRHEEDLLAAAQAVREDLSGPPLRFIGDLFQGERVFSVAAPGCDPYARLRPTPVHAPLTIPDIPTGPPPDMRTGPDVFCFLWSDHRWLNLVLTALNGLERRSEVHIRGIDPAVLVPQCAPQVGIRPQSADFATLLPQTRLFIHYGGAGASYAALLAGTPQLILPLYLEQEMTTVGMIQNGVAVGLKLDASATASGLRDVIAAMLGNTALQNAALIAAAQTRSKRPAAVLPEIVATCRQFMGNSAARI